MYYQTDSSIPSPGYNSSIISISTTSSPFTSSTARAPMSPDAEIAHLEHMVNLFRLICAMILTPPICLIGFASNVVNIFVLTREWMSCSTNVYLTAVATFDLTFLLFSFLFSFWSYSSFRQFRPFVYSLTVIRGTANFASNTTTWLTLCFTLERYIVVTWPLFGRRFCTQSRARCVVSTIVGLSLLLTLPDYLETTVKFVPRHNTTDNSTAEYSVQPENTWFHAVFARLGYHYLNPIIFVFLPLLLLIVFNGLLVRTVVLANRKRQHMMPYQQRHKTASSSSRSKLLHGRGGRGTSGLTGSRTAQKSVDDDIETAAPIDDRGENDHSLVMVKERLEDTIRKTVNITSNIATRNFAGKEPNSSSGQASGRSKPLPLARRPMLGEQQRLTVMLISIVMAFVLLQLPSTIPRMFEVMETNELIKMTLAGNLKIRLYINISNLLLIINAALNFVLYSLFSAKFRQTFFMLLQKFLCSTSRSASGESRASAADSVRSRLSWLVGSKRDRRRMTQTIALTPSSRLDDTAQDCST